MNTIKSQNGSHKNLKRPRTKSEIQRKIRKSFMKFFMKQSIKFNPEEFEKAQLYFFYKNFNNVRCRFISMFFFK